MAGYLCWTEKLQGVSVVPNIHIHILLGMLRGHRNLVMDRSFKRCAIYRDSDAYQLRVTLYNLRDNRVGLDRVYRLASQLGIQGSNDY